MPENGLSVFPKAQDDVLKCLVLSTTQRCLVYCHRGRKKLGNIHVQEVKIRENGQFSGEKKEKTISQLSK